MLKAIKHILNFQNPQWSAVLFFHLFFILVLCCVHLGFHFLDFLHLQSPQNFFEGALILTSMDAYHYAKGVRDFLALLSGSLEWKEIFDVLSSLHFLALLGGILAKWTSLEFALTWSSVFLSASTAVILYLLIYQILRQAVWNLLQVLRGLNQPNAESLLFNNFPLCLQFLAFVASLIAILLPSFYQRVVAGYFDTDMLLLALPLLAFIFLLQFLTRRDLYLKSLVLFGIFGYLAIAWHNGIQNLLLLGFILFVLLEAIQFLKTRVISHKTLALLAVFLIILAPSPFCFLALVLLLFGIAKFPQKLWIWLIFSLGYAVCFGALNPLVAQMNAYIFGATQHANAYVYAPVVNGILETMPTSFSVLFMRSGGLVLFCLALFGFVAFGVLAFGFWVVSLKYGGFLEYLFKIFLLKFSTFKSPCAHSPFMQDSQESLANPPPSFQALLYLFVFLSPFAFLGLASVWLGMRFSFFLTPVIALGIAFVGFIALNLLKKIFAIVLLSSSAVIALFIANLHYQIPPPILTNAEIQAFKDLDSKLTSQDILLSWWDYGYALRYFTKAQVLLDGARHSGAANFPIAKILLSPSLTLFYNFSLEIAQAMQTLPPKQWNQIFEILSHKQGANAYLQGLELESKPPTLANGTKVYWVLPLRILPLLANINTFMNLDLDSGKAHKKNVFVFWDSTQKMSFAPQTTLRFYEGFYTQEIDLQGEESLTQINFGKNSLLLNTHYLKSNMIQILLFANYPNQVSASGDIVRILQLH